MPHIDVNGQSIHYTDSGGDNVPVVLCHNILLNEQSLWRLVEALSADGYRVITYDARAHGETVWDGQPFTLSDVANDGVAVLDEIGVDAAVWGGEGQGASVALDAAVNHADRVLGLFLVGSQACAANDSEKSAMRGAMQEWREGMTPTTVELLSAKSTGSLAEAQERARRWVATDWVAFTPAADALENRPDLVDQLDTITVPVGLVHGVNDILVPFEGAEVIAANVAGPATLTKLDGEFHALSFMHYPQTVEAGRELMRVVSVRQ